MDVSDGTIDTTRVFHYGVPTSEEKEVYTGLLKGVCDMAMTVFPEGSTLQQLEFIIRRPLLMQGRDYGHGSTHGTGVFLGVHESFNATYAKNFIGNTIYSPLLLLKITIRHTCRN
jgi:Xaa-Pro aminopeptidase